MAGMSVGGIFSVAMIVFLGGLGNAHAREARQMCIAEKAAQSDAVFVGKVVALHEPSKKTAGVRKYALVQVLDVLKGAVPREIQFVVNGYSAELNPDCCRAGETYLFFSNLGYDVFEVSGGEFVVSTFGKGEFMSGTNGKFSTYPLKDDSVVGWVQDSSCGEHKTDLKGDVFACIREQVKGPSDLPTP
jgi:hypothetical protein